MAEVILCLLWFWIGIVNLITEVSKFDYILLWILVMMHYVACAIKKYRDKEN